ARLAGPLTPPQTVYDRRTVTAIRVLEADDVDSAPGGFRAVGGGGRRQTIDFFGARPPNRLLVAEQGARIAGVCGATVLGAGSAPRSGWIHNVVVHPDRRRGGLGTALTEAAMRWLESRRARTTLLLATDSGRPVYERLGFTASIRYAAIACHA